MKYIIFLLACLIYRFQKKTLGKPDKFMKPTCSREAQNTGYFSPRRKRRSQYWTTINFEISLGKFEIAGLLS